MANRFEKCYRCENREVGCHSKCEHYINALESQRNYRDERIARNKLESYSFDQSTRGRK